MRSVLLVIFFVHASSSRWFHLPHTHNYPATPPPVQFQRLEHFTIVDNSTGIKYNPISKVHPGRHVCITQKDVTQPVKTKQMYWKPTYQPYLGGCHNNANELCRNGRRICEKAYRDVTTTRLTKQKFYICCSGWAQVDNRSHGCNKPVCNSPCQNGATCVKPNVCQCPKGFTGNRCEYDIDECKEKPCDQICHNTHGSYKCECREAFTLKDDGQSCQKDEAEESELETTDLDLMLYENRISKLEKLLGNINPDELRKIQHSYNNLEKHMKHMEHKLNNIEQYKHDMQTFKNMLVQMERKTDKVEDFIRRYESTKIKYS